MNPLFGPAGTPDSYASFSKTSLDMPLFLSKMGLTAFEYQCGRGVNIGTEKAIQLGKNAAEYGVTMSLHSPYYISLSSLEEEKRLNSIKYIMDSARAVKSMGGNRVILHSGSCGKMPREQALILAKMTLKLALDTLDEEGLDDIILCPETMGKINQLGTVEEVVELCKIDDRMVPCIDFGHVNARTQGGLANIEDFGEIFDIIEDNLGLERLQKFHSHFSHIEYSAGGEVRHLTFEDTKFGPNFEFIAELVYKKNCSPVFICESAGTQTEDAVVMRDMFLEMKN